jgi:hypothetical protein
VPYRGYEITTQGDAFQLAFHTIGDAVAYCLEVQLQLLKLPWPKMLSHSGLLGTKTEAKKFTLELVGKPSLSSSSLLFHGLRVRMGIHAAKREAEGDLIMKKHPVTHRMTYTGLSELIGRDVCDLSHGGQIVVTAPVVKWLQEQQKLTSAWCQEHPFCIQDLGIVTKMNFRMLYN